MEHLKMVLVATSLILLAAITFAYAGTMTWSKPLPTPADATLGYGQQATKNAAALTEIRERVAAMGVFAGYSTQGN